MERRVGLDGQLVSFRASTLAPHVVPVRSYLFLGVFLLASVIATPASAEDKPTSRSSFAPESEAGFGAAILLAGYAYSAGMGGVVYEELRTSSDQPKKAFIPFAGPILTLENLDTESMVATRLVRGADCAGYQCWLLLPSLAVMGVEAALLIGSAAAQVTGAIMTVHGLARMSTTNETRAARAASLRPRLSVMPALGPNMAGASVTVVGF